MSATRAVLEYARERGFRIMTHRAFCESIAGRPAEAPLRDERPPEDAPRRAQPPAEPLAAREAGQAEG